MNYLTANRMNRKRNGGKEVDYPLNGATHPAVIRHHQIMRDLKKNETNFDVKELIQMLDDPNNGYLTQNYLSEMNGIFSIEENKPKTSNGK